MAIENEVWSEIKITVGTKDIEVAGNIANMVVPYGIYIEDYSDLENEVMEIAHIDLIEESLLEADRSKGIIHVYVNPHETPIEAVSFIEERLKEQDIEGKIKCRKLCIRIRKGGSLYAKVVFDLRLRSGRAHTAPCIVRKFII